MLQVYRSNTVKWSPSPVLALATSPDDSQVAAARKDGSLEIWLVSPGSVGWHCQITIHGDPDPNSQVSSLVWCRSGGSSSPGRLFSSSLNGSVYEWDLFDLRQKTVLVSIGVSIHQMAAAPYNNTNHQIKQVCKPNENGHANGELKSEEDESSDSEVDDDSIKLCEDSVSTSTPIALACQDGCVRLYSVSGSNKFTYTKSLPRVSGCILSVTWSPDSNIIYSGSSDGIIRCWDANLMRELYRITVGLGGLASGRELCIFSLLALRNGTLVSADETGSVQFWDSQHGTLIQAHSYHKGHAKALTAVPGHNRVFSAGSDGQVILYKLSAGEVDSSPRVLKKWVYIGYARVHTHDVNALTVAVPISQEDVLPDEKVKRIRGKKKPIDFSYHKWAHFGVPMLISAGDDTKIFAYSAKEFSKFSPHDICPAPQRAPIQLVLNTDMNQSPLLLVQGSYTLDIFTVCVENGAVSGSNRGFSGGHAAINLLAHIESDEPGKIICSTMSPSGEFLAYSGYMKTCLYELKKQERNNGRCTFAFNKNCLHKLPFAHSLVFSSDSSQLMIAGHDRRIYVLDVGHLELLHVFTPCRKEHDDELQPAEPPITKMFTSLDGQWLAAVNCFGDVYIFNLEIQRQHWFISRLDGASVTAGGFTPQNSNVLIISTSSNQVFVFDVESKQLGEWSMRHSFVLPRRYQEFPGEVIGLSFVPSSNSSSVIVYSARALCLIDFGLPIDQDDGNSMGKPQDSTLKKIQNGQINGKLKRKVREYKRETVHSGMTMENFEIRAFRHPILFLGHLSKNSLLIIEKPWMEVVRTFDSKPVHRNTYGT